MKPSIIVRGEESESETYAGKLFQYHAEFDKYLRDNFSSEYVTKMENLKGSSLREYLITIKEAKAKTVKRIISATHSWVPEMKDFFRHGNWHSVPFRCKVCKYEAGTYEYADELTTPIKVEDNIPTQTKHGTLIHFTCQEVQNRRSDSKKLRYKKCWTCGVFGCPWYMI